MNFIELNISINPPDPGRDILAALLSERGFTGFEETEQGIRTFVPEQDLDPGILDIIPGMLGDEFKVQCTTRLIPQKDWNELWEKSYEPVWIGNRVYIRAPFHPQRPDAEIELLIEPKMSFGTGHHETTSLVTGYLLEENLQNLTVLDAGCGTGILALVAEKKGASHVDAYDNDEWAHRNTLENLQHNNSSLIDVFLGGAEVIPDKKYDLIVANINLNIILNDLEHYAAHLRPEGLMILSGFYEHDARQVISKAQKSGLEYLDSVSLNQWTALKLRMK